VIQARLLPRVWEAARWPRRHRDLAVGSVRERLRLGGASQLRLYGLAGIAGLAAAGSLQAAELLLAPLTPIMAGAVRLAEPELASLLRGPSARRPQAYSLLLGALGAGAALLWGAVLLLLPDSLGVLLLGSAWLPASPLLLPVTLAAAGLSCSVGAWAGMRALGAAARSRRVQAIGSVVYLAGALGGAVLGGAAGAAWGSAAGILLGAGLWWWELRQGLRAADLAAG
jgi:hypothetical protein